MEAKRKSQFFPDVKNADGLPPHVKEFSISFEAVPMPAPFEQ